MSDSKTAAPAPATPTVRQPWNRPNRKLLETQLMLAENCRADVVVFPEAGTTIEEMLNPLYWTHVANKRLKQWDRIDVRAADGAWFAELLVTVKQPFAARVHVLQYVEFAVAAGAAAGEVPAGYEIKSRGRDGWAVIRTEDKAVLFERVPTRDDALARLAASLKALGLGSS
jgi:hypothetical protein